jgi:hypothetical protein
MSLTRRSSATKLPEAGRPKRSSLAYFLAWAFSVYFILQTLTQSVLTDAAPYIMQPSYFSTGSLYLAVSAVGFLVYFGSRFDQISFAEVYDNSWYCMAQLGYRIGAMVLAKLFAQSVSVLIMHTAGFLVTLLLSSILKFPMVVDYLPSQYFSGADECRNDAGRGDVSVDVTRGPVERPLLAYLPFADPLFAAVSSGFFAIATDRARMSDFFGLWTGSWYLWAVTGCLILALFACVRRGARLAGLFNPPAETGAPRLGARVGEGVRVVVASDSPNAFIRRQARKLEAAYHPVRRFNLLSFLSTFVLVVVIVAMLAVNLVLLVFNYASPEKETAVMGYIPTSSSRPPWSPPSITTTLRFLKRLTSTSRLTWATSCCTRTMSAWCRCASSWRIRWTPKPVESASKPTSPTMSRARRRTRSRPR